MVNVILNLSIFTVFLKNKNIIFKIRRSKVTDYAALKGYPLDAKNASKNMNQSVPIFWTRQACLGHLGLNRDHLIVSKFHNETHKTVFKHFTFQTVLHKCADKAAFMVYTFQTAVKMY